MAPDSSEVLAGGECTVHAFVIAGAAGSSAAIAQPQTCAMSDVMGNQGSKLQCASLPTGRWRPTPNGVGRRQCPVEPKGNAIVITKQASGTAKIDPLMAAFNAVTWMSANPASSQPSIFVI